jgi:ABC-2 type transport system ATP-binding protein
MKTVLGLLRADSGEITVNGEKVIYGNTETNRYIGYLPDVPEYYSFMTAEEYLRFCGEISGLKREDTENRIKELLELVGLSEEHHRIKGYSRGMKQRLGIAQALLNRPKLLIFDEPTSALDPVGRKEILDILKSLKKETTVLFSTHILSDVERICTDVAFLNDGVIEMQGALSDIKGRFRRSDFLLELEKDSDASILTSAFADLKKQEENKLLFSENDYSSSEILRFIADNNISVLKLEKLEPCLEDLFMEVTEE